MKTVDILTMEMRGVHGANRVTEKLIWGRKTFGEHQIQLRNLYTEEGAVECAGYRSTLGDYVQGYEQQRKTIEGMKKFWLYKTYPVQALMLYRTVRRCRATVKHYLQNPDPADCLIFQDAFCAYYYLKMTKKRKERTILITHADTDPLEQFILGRPAIASTYAERALRKCFKKVHEGVDKVITICSSSYQYVTDTYDTEAACILNGIEETTAAVTTKSFEKDPVHIAVLGSVTYRKGHDLLVPSLLALSEEEREKIVLHVIGKGELYRALEEEVAQHHMEEHCVLHGEVRDVTGLLGQMDAMLLPSRADTVPISIIEGLRAALPVLSTRVGEIPRMIEDCGLLIETTAQSITQGYREILGDRARFAQYSVNARNRFEQRYTLEQMISQYAAEINKMFEI